jgi:hypothetical protein
VAAEVSAPRKTVPPRNVPALVADAVSVWMCVPTALLIGYGVVPFWVAVPIGTLATLTAARFAIELKKPKGR